MCERKWVAGLVSFVFNLKMKPQMFRLFSTLFSDHHNIKRLNILGFQLKLVHIPKCAQMMLSANSKSQLNFHR